MMIRMHHAQISIPKGGEVLARDFYCNILGLQEIAKPKSLEGRGGIWLQLDGSQLHCGVESDVDRTKTKAHVAMEVDNLAEMKLKISQYGLLPEDGIPIPGYDRFEFRDPFGNRMEIIARST